MGDKISALPQATTLTGTELVPLVQGGATKQTTSASFKTTNAADLVTGTVAIARLPVGSQSSAGILQLGQNSGQACEANDARLSNSRTPSGTAGGDLAGTFPNPQLAPSGVTAGIYGSATISPQITVDAKGRITNVGSATIPIPPAADLVPLVDGTGSIGNSDKYARQDHIHPASSTTLTGDVTGSGVGNLTTTLSNTGVSQGTYGSSTRIPIVTVDAKGRVLAANTVPFASSAGGTVTSVDVSGGTTGLTTSGGPITGDGIITLDGVLSVANGGTGSATASGAIAALGAVSTGQLGAINGVATLDGSGKVPANQLPPVATGQYATLDNNGKVPLTQLYAAVTNGLATLGGDGKVPSNQLPSYVDDVVEVANFAALPNPGETGKIYVTLDTNLVWRWSGSTYVQVNAGPTPSSTTPLVAGTAAVGTSLTYARADHVHPSQVGSATPLIASGSGAVGVATLFAREDHVHPSQAGSATPLIASGSGSVGTSNLFARQDHVHPAQAIPVKTINSQSGTSYTASIGDANNCINLTNASSQVTVTIPNNSSVPYDNGTSIDLIQSGTGGVVVSPASGVDLISSIGIASNFPGSTLRLLKTGTNSWILNGNTAVDRSGYSVEYLNTFQNLTLGSTPASFLNQKNVYPKSATFTNTGNYSVISTPGRIGKSIQTPASYALIFPAINLSEPVSGPFTFEASIYKTVAPRNVSTEYLFAFRDSGTSKILVQAAVGDGTIRLSGATFVFTSYALAINTWYDICVTRDSSGNVNFFVNGTYFGQTTIYSGGPNISEIQIPYPFETATTSPFTYQAPGWVITNIRFSSSLRMTQSINYTPASILPVG
jgi:hypothetical protein